MDLYALPYEHALGDGGPRPFTKIVCIHATDNTASAAAEAGYATHRTDRTSAHFYVDDDEAYRALALDDIAFGCLYHGNRYSVQLELCGLSNQLTDATMRRAAPIVAEVCRLYGIPVEKIDASRARAAYFDGGPGGICGHADITAAFPEDNGDHTDPGASFPWSTFIGYVQAALDPAPPVQEDDMALEPTLVEIKPTNKTTSVAWSQKAAGVYAYDNMFLAIGNDTWDVTNPGSPAPAYRLRVFEGNGSGWAPWAGYKDGIVTLRSGERLALALRADTTILSIIRLPLDDGTSYDGMLTALVGYEKA